MPRPTTVADSQAGPNKADLHRRELRKLLPVSRKEDGCTQYDLHEDIIVAEHILIYATWESYDRWERHSKAPHLAAYLNAIRDADVERTFYRMTYVD